MDDFFSSEDLVIPSMEFNSTELLDSHYQELVGSLSDFISGEELAGAELAKIQLSPENYWHPILSNDVFFDTDLTYSSHEIIELQGNNTVYETSPHDSLIFVGAGTTEITMSEKNADIFLTEDSLTKLEGQNTELNIFTNPSTSQELELKGIFSKISLNVYFEDDQDLSEAIIVGDQVFLNSPDTPLLDLSNIEYRSSALEINMYTDGGFQTSQSLDVLLPEAMQNAPPEYFYKPQQEDILPEVLFDDEVDIITLIDGQTLGGNQNASETLAELEGLIYKDTAAETFETEFEQLVVDIVTEPGRILEAGRLFDDPLDVFDGTDLV
ncbi:hypothetical protein N8Z70_01825 [Candidatus Puniceispirillum sp.]|nr:hypothetical protein [Candidatus Puniceispirillum sp.]